MTLQQLHYIVALDDHRHFVKAAQACFVTQPTLTMQVQKLEEEMEIVLFDRNTKPVSPTAIGKVVIAHARAVVREAVQLQAMVDEFHSGIAGRYRLGVIPTLAPYLLPLFLPAFAAAHPQVELVVDERHTSRIVKALRRGDLDLGLLAAPVEDPELTQVPLFKEPLLAYLSEGHPLWHQNVVDRSALNAQAMWLLGEGHCFREVVLGVCKGPSSAGHSNLLYESGSIETLKQLVRHGHGMTLVPELSVEPGDHHARRIAAPEPVREVLLVMRKGTGRKKLLSALETHILAAVGSRLSAAPMDQSSERGGRPVAKKENG
jgi:LysR family transcriptional regulator, hydrogen peroxide-inducible genes activator